MREDDLRVLALGAFLLILLGIAAIALATGNIVNQLFASVPSVGGPLGAAAALFVFVYLVGKGASLVLRETSL